MQDDSKVFKPTYIAIAYEYPEVGKSFICFLLEKGTAGIEYKMARIGNVRKSESLSTNVYRIHSKKRIFYVQIFK